MNAFRYPNSFAERERLIARHRDVVTTRRRRKTNTAGVASYETRYVTPDGSEHRDMLDACIHLGKQQTEGDR